MIVTSISGAKELKEVRVASAFLFEYYGTGSLKIGKKKKDIRQARENTV